METPASPSLKVSQELLLSQAVPSSFGTAWFRHATVRHGIVDILPVGLAVGGGPQITIELHVRAIAIGEVGFNRLFERHDCHFLSVTISLLSRYAMTVLRSPFRFGAIRAPEV